MSFLFLSARGQILLANHARWVIDGDSISAFSSWQSWWRWASLLSGGKLYIPPGGVTSVGGSNTSSVISRLPTDEGFFPKLYSVMIGTNNSGPYISALQTIYAGMIGAGALVNAIPVIPKTGGLTSDQIAANAFVNALAGSIDYAVTDIGTVFDPAVDAESGGLHPNALGGYLLGNAWATAMAPVLTGASILPTTVTAENLCNNPLMTGTAGSKTGTATGTVADNWTVFYSATGSSTCVASKDTLANGQAAQALTFSGTGSGLFQLRNSTITINGNPGDNFEAWCAAEWSGTGLLGAQLKDTNGTVFTGGDNGSVAETIFSPVTGGVLRAFPITLVGTQTTISVYIIGQVAAGASVTPKFGQFMVRKVPSGQ